MSREEAINILQKEVEERKNQTKIMSEKCELQYVSIIHPSTLEKDKTLSQGK